jgi:uncharacterized protein YjbI with pentapeptide repeats
MKRKDRVPFRVEVREVGWAPPPPKREVSGELRGVRFETDGKESVSFWDAQVDHVDFSGNRFWNFWTDASRFSRCDFRNVKFDALRLGNTEGAVFTDSAFDGADLSAEAALGRVRFERCSFDGAKAEGWFSFEGEFVDCSFATKVVECTFHGHEREDERRILDRLFRRPLRPNEFRGNDFRQAELRWTVFTRGIDISAQLWPEGEEYVRLDRVPERLARVRETLLARPRSERREELLRLLDEFYGFLWAGQEEVFTRRERLEDAAAGDPYEELDALIEAVL